MNNFYASVECLYRPEIRDFPVAVAGDPLNRHGIILAKNMLAKKLGVKTGEAIWQAKLKAPNLVTVPPDFRKYLKFSRLARQILYDYTDQIEPFGIDENWIDVTGSKLLCGDGSAIANSIRQRIKEELGITVSIGVSFNKIFAKLGSDMKKPDAVTVISRENFKQKVWPLPVENMLFVGKKTVEKLNSLGAFTVRDVTEMSDETLKYMFGKNGLELKKYAMGEDDSPIISFEKKEKPKSVGRSVTESEDFTDNDAVWQTFIILAEDISKNLRRYNLFAAGIQVHTRNSELAVREFSHALDTPTDISIVIAEAGMKLFKENYYWDLPLRSVGLRAINLRQDVTAVQQDLFSDLESQKKLEKIEDSIHSIRKKYGDTSIKRGRTIK